MIRNFFIFSHSNVEKVIIIKCRKVCFVSLLKIPKWQIKWEIALIKMIALTAGSKKYAGPYFVFCALEISMFRSSKGFQSVIVMEYLFGLLRKFTLSSNNFFLVLPVCRLYLWHVFVSWCYSRFGFWSNWFSKSLTKVDLMASYIK